MNNFSTVIEKYLGTSLFRVSGTDVTLFSIIIFLIIILSTIALSYVVQRGLKNALKRKFAKREGTLAALLRLLHYSVIIVGFGIGLQIIGININTLFAAGAVFTVAIGFATQNVIQNFVSGVLLLLERSIKPWDILEVEGTVVKVIDMGIRTTVVRTWREEELIMPNSIISQSTVKNYTLRDNEFRIGVVVGVAYNSDVEKVMEVLQNTANKVSWRLAKPEPRVLLLEFADSSLNFGVYLNIDDPWNQRVYMSDLRKDIWFAFKEAGITIAFPQLDVHFDPPLTEAMVSNLWKAV